MARGGYREGAGRKADPVPAEPKAADSRQPLFSTEAVEMILRSFEEHKAGARERPRTPDWNPYIIRPERFGPVAAHVREHRPGLAMDKNKRLAMDNQVAVQAWQAGGLLSNLVSEGLLFLGYPYLSELAQRPEYRLFGEIRAQEMTRKWIEYRPVTDESTKEKDAKNAEKTKNNPDDENRAREKRMAGDDAPRTDGRNKEIEEKIKELDDAMEEFKVRGWFQDVAAQDSFFGLSHLYVDLKGTNLDNPRDPELATSIGNGRDKTTANKVQRGSLKGFRTIEPIWCYPTVYNAQNPLVESWYDPQVWYVMGAEIHKTRLLPFVGRPVPDILKPAYAFGGLAMTQMAQPYVNIWLRTRESVGALIHAFSVMILQTNLGTTTMPGGAGGGAGDVLARMALFTMLRDNQGLFVVDKNTEDFKNVSAPLGGLDELQAQAQEHMFSVGRIPAVKFAGIQPKGLNATSEGEMRAFYDTIIGEQNHLFRPNLTTISDIVQTHLWGACDKDITYDFVPLWEQTEKEKAEIRKIDAETAQILIDSGQISQEEARRRLATDPESGYHEIDPDDVPELLEEETEGLIPEGAGRGIEAELQEAQGGKVGGDAADEPTLSKSEANYVDSWRDAATRCRRCSMFTGEHRCTLVKGSIRPVGHCEHFDAKGAKDDAPTREQTRRNAEVPAGAKDGRQRVRPFARDDFKESDHPRVKGGENAGQFAPAGGGGSSSSSGGETSTPDFQKNALKMMEKPAIAGANYRRTLMKMIKEASAKHNGFGVPGLKKLLVESWQKTHANAVKKGKGELANSIAKKLTKLGAPTDLLKISKPDVEKNAAVLAQQEAAAKAQAWAAKQEGEAAKSEFGEPTQAELQKASGTNPLKMQFLGVEPNTTQSRYQIEDLVKAFNYKYAGKALKTGAELVQKVNDFKKMVAQAKAINAAQAAQAAAEAAEKAEKAKAEAEAKAKEKAEKNKLAMKELGITDQQATGFNALVDMYGGDAPALIEKFKKYENEAKAYGYPVTGFQAALIKNYSNGGYGAVNSALRSGTWTEAQHEYVRQVNKALRAMPSYTGTVKRGTKLSAGDQAKYVVGNVVEERAFTSTSVTKPWGGNTQYTIKAIGKHGADIKKLSNHPGENEVLFSARTFFRVTKVEGQPGGTMHVHMEEMEE